MPHQIRRRLLGAGTEKSLEVTLGQSGVSGHFHGETQFFLDRRQPALEALVLQFAAEVLEHLDQGIEDLGLGACCQSDL